MDEVYEWSSEQFKAISGENNLELNIDDMRAVRELAVRKFGYAMYVFEQVVKAYRDFINN